MIKQLINHTKTHSAKTANYSSCKFESKLKRKGVVCADVLKHKTEFNDVKFSCTAVTSLSLSHWVLLSVPLVVLPVSVMLPVSLFVTVKVSLSVSLVLSVSCASVLPLAVSVVKLNMKCPSSAVSHITDTSQWNLPTAAVADDDDNDDDVEWLRR